MTGRGRRHWIKHTKLAARAPVQLIVGRRVEKYWPLLGKAEEQIAAKQSEKLAGTYQYLPAFLKAKAKSKKPETIGSDETGYYRWNPDTGTFEQVIAPAPKDDSFSLGFDPITGQPYVLNKNTGQLNGGGGGSVGGGVNYGQGLKFNTGAQGMRTDRHNNPTAFTTDVAKLAGLVEGVDYVVGDPFPNNPNLKTAKLLGDPIATTIRVIDKIGFYTQSGKPRWTYINSIPDAKNWANLSYDQKARVIAQMYAKEGGNGSLVQGSGGGVIANLAAQALQNPTILDNLPEAQKKAVYAYLAQNGAQIPANTKPLTGEALNKKNSLDVLESLANQAVALGERIGWEGVGGLFKGSISQFLAKNFGRGSQEEQQLRNLIGNIKATLAKERGGTSFTENEQALLETYTPTIDDSPLVLKSKLASLMTYIQQSKSALLGNTGGLQPFSAPSSGSNDPLGLGI